MEYNTYHDLIQEEFERRKVINTSYSLRAFARDLDLTASRLSQILNKKQGMSLKTAEQISRKLKLTAEQRDWFYTSVGSLHSRDFKLRNDYKTKADNYKTEAKAFTQIHLEYFKVISDWYHFAILELTYVKEFQSDPQWIARILGISVPEVTVAIERMKQLDLLREENGMLLDAFKLLETPTDVSSTSLKKFNTQLMKKAMDALYEQDVLEREIVSDIFAIRKDRVPEIKSKLRKFRRELEDDLIKDENKDAVYCLNMQFFSLTNEELV